MASQEGYRTLADRYDDGGFSGGTTERPALQRLLADAHQGRFDAVVVYRLDRLSRSLADFVRIHEFLEKRGIALVSVTESINTQTPHGRMMVNVLLSFAQYERELAGERTAHKLAAARRKGKFVGGYPVLGYDCDPRGGKLVVNETEAGMVREIFRLFIEKRSLVLVADELTRRGWTLKRWTTKEGKVFGGGRFDKNSLRRMLTNYTVRGKVNFQGTVYDGEHEGIVSPKVFREVQRILEENRRDGGASQRNRCGALLRGILRCASCDAPMVHTWTKKGTKAYRWYRCPRAMKRGATTCPTRSIQAAKVEEFVVAQIKRIGSDPALQAVTFREAVAQVAAQRRGLKAEAKRVERDLAAARRDVERLVATLSRTTGPAEQAVHDELEKTQERVATIQARLVEVREQEATLASQQVDEADLARALEAFDPIWDVLLTPEKERVPRLLVERVSYDGATEELRIDFRLGGLATLAADVASAESTS